MNNKDLFISGYFTFNDGTKKRVIERSPAALAGDSHTGLLALQVADERQETESFWVCPSCTATSAGDLCDYCGRPPDDGG